MATENNHKYISVAYKLYAQAEGNEPEMVEEATVMTSPSLKRRM